ncbi:MAG: bifunctional precorrin-2 dehydrogenase/sirohydrochlorin ferrochelatase [Clostridia bacterium]|nr:bifunctional precorrin-2 dehydrogenase/sirohydrochlorin ferrochelatase [Clostridia bacterium]
MTAFPLFVDLKGKKCVVAGGGKVAARKIETLVLFNAEITVVSPQVTESIVEQERLGKLAYREKPYSDTDIEGAFLVVAATSSRQVNDKIYEDAVSRGIFVNVADSPEKCTFIFPSVVKRDELVIGICTSGNYPLLSKSVREKLDNMLPRNLDGRVNGILGEYRRKALDKMKNEEKRQEFLKKMLDEVLSDELSDIEPLRAKIEKIFGDYENEKDS